MSVSALSKSTQDYLKAVWTLSEWSQEPVTPSSLAARVGVKLSTASDAIRKLTAEGLIKHTPYSAVTLTDKGRELAVSMVRRHRLLEAFLVETLGYRWDQVHDEAENLEHAVSDFMVQRMDEHLGYPERDPHGDPIPSSSGVIAKPDAIPLSDLGPGNQARVERIADDDPELLQFFAQHSLRYGTLLQTREAAPFSDTIEVLLDGHTQMFPLGVTAARSVWVALLPAV